MPEHRLTEMTWEEVAGLEKSQAVALLPIGATEAHGPHLPISTDVIISEAMVADSSRRLAAAGRTPITLPPLAYTAASFGADFPGTISIGIKTMTAMVVDIARGVAQMGIPVLGFANSHLDPAHLQSLYEAIRICRDERIISIAFPDITRKPWAMRLTDEFKSGACHAGQYEGSIVMAAQGHLVRGAIQKNLPDVPASLSDAIRAGKQSFAEAGGERAYFGFPSQASHGEGEQTIATLGEILTESIQTAFVELGTEPS